MKKYRWLDKLKPRFRKKVALFLKEVWNKIFITETWRSQERQRYLYSFWRTRKGKKKTWTLNSMHTKGLAIDIAFRWRKLYPKDLYVWKEVFEIAQKYWINRWFDLWEKDKPHFEDNWKELWKKKIFLDNSKFWKFIQDDLEKWFKFNNYLDNRPASIADVKELITLYDRRNWLPLS